jgi:superfamily II DNA or RNA helicase
MPFVLRPYQQELVQQTNDAVLEGLVPCLTAPTGSGKTVCISELVRLALERDERVVIACHRNEILRQLHASAARHLGERIGVLSASHTSPDQRVVCTMIPTLARRKAAVQRLKGRTLILDEFHHISSASWKRVVSELEPLHLLGATATPIAPDGSGLGKHGVGKLILGPHPKWLMDQGSLCNYKLFAATGEVNTDGVKVRGGDYAVDELAERVVEISGSIIRDYERFNPKRAPTITVAVNIEHAYEVAKLYNDAGYSAEVVIGTTPQEVRKSAFERFEDGRLKVIVSVALIEEGLDICSAECLQLLRPTKSIRLWKQLCGRVLRPSPGKEFAVILDHGGSWRNLPLPCEPIEWSLLERPKRPSVPREIGEDREIIEAPAPLAIKENRFLLSEIDPAFELGQRLLKKQAALRKNLYLAERKGFPSGILTYWANNPQGVSPDDRRRIERLMNLPLGWIDQQTPQVV